MRPLRSVAGITDPYTHRILSNVINKDPLSVFALTPRRLRSLLKGISRRQAQRAPAKDKWSIQQIVCHLCDSEIVLGFRLRMALAQSGCRLQAMDEKLWARNLGYDKVFLDEKIALFEKMRKDHVRTLRSLPSPAWKRFGIHEERGKETIERMVQMYAGHDLNHLKQIRSIRSLFTRGDHQ
jgi:hypothetical protein